MELFVLKSVKIYSFYYFVSISFIALAAFLPAPIANITVAAPETASPPAYTLFFRS